MRQESTGVKTLAELSIATLARTIRGYVHLNRRWLVHHTICHAQYIQFFHLQDGSKTFSFSFSATTLDGLPEELALDLLERVLALDLLTPKVLELFEKMGHTEVDIRITELNIQELPLLLPTTRNRWLGY